MQLQQSQAIAGDFGSSISDLFAGVGDFEKASGDELEAQNYRQAAQLAINNETFEKTATAIKQSQADRELFTSMGRTTAAVGGSNLSLSGSALDILRQSASEGALTRATLGQQGLISEQAYQQQADSYNLMATAADHAAGADKIAGIGSFIGAGIQGIAGLAGMFAPTAAATAVQAVTAGADWAQSADLMMGSGPTGAGEPLSITP